MTNERMIAGQRKKLFYEIVPWLFRRLFNKVFRLLPLFKCFGKKMDKRLQKQNVNKYFVLSNFYRCTKIMKHRGFG